MPGIPKGLLRLCRLGSKRRNHNSSADPESGQNGNHDSTKEITGSPRPIEKIAGIPDDCSGSNASINGATAQSCNGISGEVIEMAFPCLRRPLSCLEEGNKDSNVALMILNQPLDALRQQLTVLWNRSVLKAVVDGGANRLYECVIGNHQNYVPDLISGDFDSIRPEILLYYQSKGAKIVKTPDQNYTDFTKCLRLVVDTIECSKQEVDCIVVLGAFGDRLDQTLANINTLYEANLITKVPVYLLADGSLGCLLRPGKHVIEVNTGLESDWCGLVPIGHKCRQVTTTGLKWNLDHQPMQFGSLISTSNTYSEGAEVVTVQTDQPLLWTMGIRSDKSK
ncbi:thiamine pyrophosphokinase 1-like [Asterias amurensis]|uniref:thiamine pyrophosphokinase 1-like n=1 Tax=Asterias amurensis TaxID=7602 RepID=UPI003AB14C88